VRILLDFQGKNEVSPPTFSRPTPFSCGTNARRRNPKGSTGGKALKKTASDPREIRRKRGLNQQEFWPLIGVTQSGGSRYETGRRMPVPVRELLRIVHVEGVPLNQVRGEDHLLIQHLKKSRPGLYRELKAAALREQKNGK
jgi:DNA-binding transcriptional regulator YiaG